MTTSSGAFSRGICVTGHQDLFEHGLFAGQPGVAVISTAPICRSYADRLWRAALCPLCSHKALSARWRFPFRDECCDRFVHQHTPYGHITHTLLCTLHRNLVEGDAGQSEADSPLISRFVGASRQWRRRSLFSLISSLLA